MKDALRVLVVHNRYRSTAPSGEDRVVDQESAALREAGHEVELFEARSDDIDEMGLARRALVPARVVWSHPARRALRARLGDLRPDVVHLHNTFPLLSPSVLAACRDAGVPVVATVHNYKLLCASGDLFREGTVCHDCLGRSPWPALRHGCYRASRAATAPIVVSLVAHRARWAMLVDRFIAISRPQRDLLVSHGLPAAKVVVKHNFTPEPSVRRAGPGHAAVFLGRLSREKGIDVLLGAWEELVTGPPDARPVVDGRLVVAGGGPLAAEVERFAARYPDTVEFAGHQDRAGCEKLLARARVAVIPSTWEETFGLVVAEAMAAGVAPVASRLGSFPDLVDDGRTGVLFPAGDTTALAGILRDAFADPDRFTAMGAAARAAYEQRFAPAAGVRRLVAVYREAMACH